MKKERILEVNESRDLVIKLYYKMKEVINEETKDINEVQKWLIMGRAINTLFSWFYSPAIANAEKTVNQEDLNES